MLFALVAVPSVLLVKFLWLAEVLEAILNFGMRGSLRFTTLFLISEMSLKTDHSWKH